MAIATTVPVTVARADTTAISKVIRSYQESGLGFSLSTRRRWRDLHWRQTRRATRRGSPARSRLNDLDPQVLTIAHRAVEAGARAVTPNRFCGARRSSSSRLRSVSGGLAGLIQVRISTGDVGGADGLGQAQGPEAGV
jgi:hypothetical protein